MSSSFSSWLGLCLVVLSIIGRTDFAPAGTVSTWRHAAKTDYDKATLDGLVISREGEISLGREVRLLSDLKCASVWDLTATGQGKWFAATAVPGQVVELQANGGTRTVWRNDMVQAFSLASQADGSLILGTGPGGAIYRLASQGPAKLLYQTEAQYIWDLVVDAEDAVYAATGPQGRIYKIEANGQGSVFYETKQPHALCLAWASDGRLLVGTDGAGLVLAIDRSGQGRVLYDTAEGEVRSLLALPDGTILAGTAAGGTSMGSSSSSSTSSSSTSSTSNSLYRLDPSGAVRKLMSGKSLCYSLGLPSNDPADELLCGTGTEGLLYSVPLSARGERQLAKLDTELILSVLPVGSARILLATGNPGRVYQLSGNYVSRGTLTSPPLDAKMAARFGELSWRGERPRGSQVSLSVRSGNTELPDATWSPWSVEQTDTEGAPADCPPARFLQYRLTLTSTAPGISPVVRSVALRYQTANQPPEISKLVVPHLDEGDGKKLVDKLKLSWTATDPNQDDLLYTLRFRKPEWNGWVLLKDELTASEFEWDLTGVPEGVYRLQLEATDRKSNPAVDARQTTFTSEEFVVDRAGPKVTAQLKKSDAAGQAQLEIEAADAISPIAAASYALDSGTWQTLFPTDGLLGSKAESFSLSLGSLKPGTHVVVVRITDAAGFTSSADVVFEMPRREKN